MKHLKYKLNLLLVSICLFACSTQAGIIYQAVSVSSPAGEETNNPLIKLIDQSGLSANYTSGVTDFDSFVNNTTASTFTQNNVGAVAGAQSNTATFNFDLGTALNIGGVAIWNQVGSASLKEFDIFGSIDGSTFSLLQSGSVPQPTNTSAEPSHVFSWASTGAQYIRLVTTENFGFSTATRFNEIAFNVVEPSQVPVSSSILFFLIGIVGTAIAVRTKQK